MNENENKGFWYADWSFPIFVGPEARFLTAINEGATVLGFGFMDKEELGERLVQAWTKKHGS